MGLKIYTEPAAEPLSLEEAKAHLRVDHAADDTLIRSLIKNAREDVERLCALALITQTWDMVLDGWPSVPLRMPVYPLATIVSVKWKSAAGVEATITSTNYIVDAINRPGRITLIDGYNWPTDELYPLNAITIRFTAGFGAAGSNVPERFRHAIRLLIGHYYENREAVYASVGGNVQRLPMGVTSLLANDIHWVGRAY